jgi:hypothetical protein
VKLTWYGGGLMPPRPEEIGDTNLPDRGILFIGDKGKLLAEGAGGPPRLLPITKTGQYKKPEPTLPRVKGHHRSWLDGCKGGNAPTSNFEYASKLTEVVLLGLLALRTRKKIHWDAANMKAPNVPDADAIIHETYRKGWEVA